MTKTTAPPPDPAPAPPPRRRGRRALKITAGVVAVLLVGGGGFVWWGYEHLNHNITAEPLYLGTGPTGTPTPTSSASASPSPSPSDPFGRKALNILVIGTDSRADAADCDLGGECDSGDSQRADVEMLVHLSADRSNATVMSIPRDLLTEMPGCKDAKTGKTVIGPRYGMINSALDYGAGCSVAAVDQLTGITVDHFVQVDFSGVVSMSDAVGGVPMCVDKNVYDPQSGLKLKAGTHTLKGQAALQFLRTRHGFLDGTDLGRTYAQHLFLSRAIDEMKSAGTLTNPLRLWDLANAATHALTVDEGLNNVFKLESLAQQLNKVPSDRITFVTMQNDLAHGAEEGRVLLDPAALKLFAAIKDDRSLSATPANGATDSSTPSPSDSASASASASASGAPSASASASPSGSPSSGSGSAKGSGGDPAALEGAHALNAADDSGCAEVSTFYTTSLPGYGGMTPTQAYADSPNVKDSAP